MMRLRSKGPGSKGRMGSRDPISEGIEEPERKRRDWGRMTHAEIIAEAKAYISVNGITGRKELERRNRSLYSTLRIRKLIGSVGLAPRNNGWASMSDDELVAHAKRVVEGKGICKRHELEKRDVLLYSVLLRRKLLDRVGFKVKKKQTRDWASMGDDGLVGFAKGFVSCEGISDRGGLKRKGKGLYFALWGRDLLDRVLPESRRGWSAMAHEEIIAIARAFIEKEGIKARKELRLKNPSIYSALHKRKLLDRIGLSIKRRRNDIYAYFAEMSDDELVAFARDVVQRKGIGSKEELQRSEKELSAILRERKLLYRQDFKGMERRPNGFFLDMGDDELVVAAMLVMEKRGLRSRNAIRKHDHTMYEALKKRHLWGMLPLEQNRRRSGLFADMSDDELIRRAKEEMSEKGITTRSELAKRDALLYDALRKRNLFDEAGFRSMHRWASMTDEELIVLGKRVIAENDIETRYGLDKANHMIYHHLWRRGLLDAVGLPTNRKGRQRKWVDLSDEELLGTAARIIAEKGISTKTQLGKADGGLFWILKKRDLLDRVDFKRKMRKNRSWAGFSDETLVEYAKRIMGENGIRTRSQLAKADSGLHRILVRRDLIDRIGFESGYRWVEMTDEELLSHAKGFIKSRGIGTMQELMEADMPLYGVLLYRKMLKRAFADVKGAEERRALQQVVQAIGEFGDKA